MMEENNDILLVGGDALVYLENQCTKNIPQHLFGAIHLVRTYLMTNFSTPLLLYAPVHILDDPFSIPPVAYVLNGWPFFYEKTNKNIRISYSLKYKH